MTENTAINALHSFAPISGTPYHAAHVFSSIGNTKEHAVTNFSTQYFMKAVCLCPKLKAASQEGYLCC